MPDRSDDFDRALADRLRTYEAGLPAADAPRPKPLPEHGRRWPVLAAGGLAAVAAGMLLAGVIGWLPDVRVGQTTPSASPSRPPLSPSPTAGVTRSPSPTDTQREPSPSPTLVPGTPAPTATPAPPPIETLLDLDVEGRTALVSALQPFGGGRFIAAVNTFDWESAPPIGPQEMTGSIHVGTPTGGWEAIDAGDTFQGVEITDLFVAPDGRLVAYGVLEVDEAGTSAVGFTSTDGRTWTRMPDLPWAADGFVRLAGGPAGYVAAATFNDAESGFRVVVYRSPDATSWEVSYETPATAQYYAYDIGSGEEGLVMAAYRHDPETDEGHGVTIASGDGVTWFESAEDGALPRGVTVTSVAPFGPDWVATGFGGADGTIPVYWSANGLHWSHIATIDDPADREWFGYGAHLLADGGRLFLSAAFQAEGTESRPAGVWSSSDARTWTMLPLGDRTEIRAVAAVDGAWLVGGRVGDPGGNAVVWRAADAWFR